MKPLSLENAFNIAFFDKDSFQSFLSFQPLEQIKIGNFEGRTITEPNSKLKNYHKFINEFILSYLNVNKNIVFSYRKGSSTYDAVKLHADSKVFFNTDIKHFFPSVSRDYAKWVLNENISSIPISDIENYIEIILNYIIVDDSLPMGFSTSPAFSNACLYGFDNALQDYCLQKELIYSRYSDDIIVSSKNDEGFENIQSVIINLLNQHGGFKINESKTKLIRKGGKIKLLGMVILPSGKISVDIKVKQRLEHLIHFYVSDKNKFINSIISDSKIKTKNLNEGEIMDKGVSTISGLLNHINTIDKSYLDKLRKKYGNAVVDMLFYKNAN